MTESMPGLIYIVSDSSSPAIVTVKDRANGRSLTGIAAAGARIIRQAAGLEEPDPQRKPRASEETPQRFPTLTFDEWVAPPKQNKKVQLSFIGRVIESCLLTAHGPISLSTGSTSLTSKHSKLGL